MYEQPPRNGPLPPLQEEEFTVRNWHAPALDAPQEPPRPVPVRRAPARPRADLMELARFRAEGVLQQAREDASRARAEGHRTGLEVGLAEGAAAIEGATTQGWSELAARTRAALEADLAAARRRGDELQGLLAQELERLVETVLVTLMGPDSGDLAPQASERLHREIGALLRLDEDRLRATLERTLQP